jgi:hypothetical protein
LTEIEQVMVKVRMHRTAQYRVAEIAGGHRLQLPVTLVTDRLRGLLEEEKFILGGCAHQIAHIRSSLEHAPQRAPGANLLGAPAEFPQHQNGFGLVGDVAPGLGNDAYRGIGIGGVPARELGVVVELVVRIPAQNHVAESHVLVERGEKLIAIEILAAQDAVGIEDADLDVLDPALSQSLPQVVSLILVHLCAQCGKPSFGGAPIIYATL